jgi:hypothetical protein
VAASHGEQDYVVTDAEGAMVAVVRPRRDLPLGGVPRWGFKVSDYRLVVERDGVAGIAVTYPAGARPRMQVWAGLGVLLGEIHYPSPEDALISFSDPTGGRGDVRRCPNPSTAWRVTDRTGLELARVTPRPVALPAPTEEGQPKPRRLAARWAAAIKPSFRSLPEGCEVVETGPTFDWVRHGLTIVVAASCDRKVRRRALLASGGGG